MLIQFTVGNYRSFREPVTLSLEAAAISSRDKDVDKNCLIQVDDRLQLLTSAAIYGANASGKSNLVAALNFMRAFVRTSASAAQEDEPIGIIPFRLSTATIDQPAHFEVVFLVEGHKYRYGFDVSRKRVEREWLYMTPTRREAELFHRTGDEIRYNPRSFREGRGLVEKTRPNALFLSVAAQWNGPIAKKILEWFRKVWVIFGLDDLSYRQFTSNKYLENRSFQEQILKLVHSLDLGIDKINVEMIAPDEVKFPKGIPDELLKYIRNSQGPFFATQARHVLYDENGKPSGLVDFDLDSEESGGTNKLFYLSGPILQRLSSGGVLVIDEMEARMHPLITYEIIRLFNSLETNPKRAQLIFTTHDTNLLDRNLLRRDQIWFLEKDTFGASHLYSLVEFKPRNDEALERNYLRGKYGAVPYLGEFRQIMEEKSSYLTGETDDGA